MGEHAVDTLVGWQIALKVSPGCSAIGGSCYVVVAGNINFTGANDGQGSHGVMTVAGD